MQIASGDFPEMARWRGKKHGGSRVGSSYPKMQLVSPRKQLSQPYFQWNHPTYHHEIAFRTSRRAMKIGLLCLQSPCSRLFRMRWRRTWAEGTCIAEERNKLKGLMGRIFSQKKTFKLSWTSQTSFSSIQEAARIASVKAGELQVSPWSRDGNQRMFLLRDRRWWQGWWWFRCLKPMLILLLEDCIVHQWSLRTSREFVQRQLWGIHAGRLGATKTWWYLVMTCVMPIYPNKKIIQSCFQKVVPRSELKNFPPWRPNERYFQSSNPRGNITWQRVIQGNLRWSCRSDSIRN